MTDNTAPAARPAASLPATLLRRVGPLLGLIGAMWALELIDLALGGALNRFGVRSWDPAGLLGIVAAPLLHANLGHLIANTGPLLVLGAIVIWQSRSAFWVVTAASAIVSGLGAWLVNAPGTLTVGASGLVFGYFAYLIARAFVARGLPHRVLYAVIAALVVVGYGGSMLAGLVPNFRGVSWQGHLFGGLGGVLAAYLLARVPVLNRLGESAPAAAAPPAGRRRDGGEPSLEQQLKDLGIE